MKVFTFGAIIQINSSRMPKDKAPKAAQDTTEEMLNIHLEAHLTGSCSKYDQLTDNEKPYFSVYNNDEWKDYHLKCKVNNRYSDNYVSLYADENA